MENHQQNPQQDRPLLDELSEHLLALSRAPERLIGIPRAVTDSVSAVAGSSESEAATEDSTVHLTLLSTGLSVGRETMDLNQLMADAQACRRCRLCETRNKVVFGIGKTTRPLIVFVGEGPGADEDRQGEPFVGKAGQLLTAAITKGLGLRREDVFICNVVKCRPPENRTPMVDEVEACSPFLFRQLELIAPSVIVTLGAPAQTALTGNLGGITKIRGKWLEWRGVPVMPTFHPAYILRNPAAKKPFWEDLQVVMEKVGLRSADGKGE